MALELASKIVDGAFGMKWTLIGAAALIVACLGYGEIRYWKGRGDGAVKERRICTAERDAAIEQAKKLYSSRAQTLREELEKMRAKDAAEQLSYNERVVAVLQGRKTAGASCTAWDKETVEILRR